MHGHIPFRFLWWMVTANSTLIFRSNCFAALHFSDIDLYCEEHLFNTFLLHPTCMSQLRVHVGRRQGTDICSLTSVPDIWRAWHKYSNGTTQIWVMYSIRVLSCCSQLVKSSARQSGISCLTRLFQGCVGALWISIHANISCAANLSWSRIYSGCQFQTYEMLAI